MSKPSIEILKMAIHRKSARCTKKVNRSKLRTRKIQRGGFFKMPKILRSRASKQRNEHFKTMHANATQHLQRQRTTQQYQRNLEHMDTTLKKLYGQSTLTNSNRNRIAKLRTQRGSLMRTLGKFNITKENVINFEKSIPTKKYNNENYPTHQSPRNIIYESVQKRKASPAPPAPPAPPASPAPPALPPRAI